MLIKKHRLDCPNTDEILKTQDRGDKAHWNKWTHIKVKKHIVTDEHTLKWKNTLLQTNTH